MMAPIELTTAGLIALLLTVNVISIALAVLL